MILENNEKFVKKKKNAYTAITMSLINGRWEPQTVSNFNQILIFQDGRVKRKEKKKQNKKNCQKTDNPS